MQIHPRVRASRGISMLFAWRAPHRRHNDQAALARVSRSPAGSLQARQPHGHRHEAAGTGVVARQLKAAAPERGRRRGQRQRRKTPGMREAPHDPAAAGARPAQQPQRRVAPADLQRACAAPLGVRDRVRASTAPRLTDKYDKVSGCKEGSKTWKLPSPNAQPGASHSAHPAVWGLARPRAGVVGHAEAPAAQVIVGGAP